LTIFSIQFSIHLIDKSEFSWKTRNCLDDPKLLNSSVYINIYIVVSFLLIYDLNSDLFSSQCQKKHLPESFLLTDI